MADRKNNIVEGLKLMMMDCSDQVDMHLELPIVVNVDIRSLLDKSTPCLLAVTCGSTSIELEMKPSDDAVPGLVEFVLRELKEDLEDGKIGGILNTIKKYFCTDAAERQSTTPPSDEDIITGIKSLSVIPPENSSPVTFGSSGASSDHKSHYESVFQEEEKIGKGAFGRVLKCVNKLDEAVYAVKKVAYNNKGYERAIREVRMMARIQHPNVVRYYQSWTENVAQVSSAEEDSNVSDYTPSPPRPMTLYIAMEFCTGTLKEKIDSELDQQAVSRYFLQIVQGLSIIHEKGIIHRDLSTKNILIDSANNVKICDFGLAIHFVPDGDSTIEAPDIDGNPYYIAPEMCAMPSFINEKLDIFSLGLILLEMIHGMKTDVERIKVFDEIRKNTFDWKNVNLWEYTYLPRLVALDPSNRPSANDILDLLGDRGAERVVDEYEGPN